MSSPQQIFSDLLNIEVNTIIKEDITATAMPSLPFALLDIFETFATALERDGIELGPYLLPPTEDLRALLPTLYARRHEDETLATYFSTATETYTRSKGSDFDPGSSDATELWNYLPDLWPVLDAHRRENPPPGDWCLCMDDVTNGWDSFERIRIACHEAFDGHPSEWGSIYFRIVSACSKLKFVVQGIQQRFAARGRIRKGLADWSELIPKTRNQLLRGALHGKQIPKLLRSEDFRTVRKIWELGTERVMVQTTVQVDGDVVTRVCPDLLEAHNDAIRTLVLHAHHDGVSTGVSQWKALIDTARTIFGSILDRVGRHRA